MKLGNKTNIKPFYSIIGFVVGFSIVIGIGWYNGAPWMFDATYGKNIILFFIGGISGTMVVFLMSFMLRNVKSKVIDTISVGNILILGLHPIFIRAYHLLPEVYQSVYMDYFAALVILFAFIPIIHLSKRYFPVILGSRAKQGITSPK